jgi:hypothetical protein
MHSARKLRSVTFADEPRLVQGRSVEGVVIGLGADGKVKFRDEDGQITELRVPRHVDKRWLEAAVALAPVPAMAVHPEGVRAPLLWCVFSAKEHAALDEHFRVDAKTVELSASESIHIRTGKSIVTVTAAGEVSVRGKNVTTRASNLNRIRGGAVKIN